MSVKKNFKSTVERFAGTGTWTYATIPFNAAEVWGEKGRMRVRGTVNGVEIEAALMAQGDGTHFIILTKEIRDKAGIKQGDIIECSLTRDERPQLPEIPVELQAALKKNKQAGSYFESLAPSHKKEYIKWIEEAKKEETRQNRILQAVEKLSEEKRLK